MTTRVIELCNKMNRFWSEANLNLFRCAAMIVVLLFGASEMWASATYKQQLKKVTQNDTGLGRVYASQADAEPTADSYFIEMDDAFEASESDGTYYLYAIPIQRGVVFDKWTESTTCGANAGAVTITTATDASTSISIGKASGNQSSGTYTTTTTVTANWRTANSKVTVTYGTPTDGSYRVTYAYRYLNTSTNIIEEGYVFDVNEGDAARTEDSYYTDEIRLSTSKENFLGWYDNASFTGDPLSTDKTYSYTAPTSGSASVYAKFQPVPKFYSKMNVRFATASAADGGSLYVSPEDDLAGAEFTYSEWELPCTSYAASQSVTSMNQTYYLHTQATDSRYIFKGWYADAACTSLLSTNLDYNYTISDITSQDAENPKEATVYVCFERACSHFLQVDALPATPGLGMVHVINNKYTAFPNYTKFENVASQMVVVHASNSTTNGTTYLYAQPKYGYKFSGWYTNADCTGNAASTANPYTFSTPAVSTDPLLPTKHVFYAKFVEDATFNVTYTHPSNGQYEATVLDVVNEDGEYVWGQTCVYNSEEFSSDATIASYKTDYLTLSATPNSGYKITQWTDGSATKTTASWVCETTLSAAKTVAVTFATTQPFKVGGNFYTDLQSAITAAGSSGTIIVVENAYVPAGNYTIPSGVTLLVPFDDAYTCYTTTPGSTYSGTVTTGAYKILTLGNGANITVNGSISVSAKQYGTQPYGGCVTGLHGRIHMKGTSRITLKSGANLYCWGYLTGDNDRATGIQAGQVIAESGANVYEGLQITCWRGGSAGSSSKFDSYEVFPLIQYYIQNVEVPLTLQKGATETVYTGVTASGSVHNGTAVLIGTSSGLFRLSSGSLTKWYNAVIDKQMYKIEGSASLESLSLKIAGILTINSSDYVLPLNNMDIQVATGTLSCSQKIAVIPGSSITIDKGSKVIFSSSGQLFVYDKDQWPNDGASAYSYNNVSFKPVPYTPTGITTKRTYANMPDGQININGTFETQSGHFYATSGKADVCSKNQTGKVTFIVATGTKSVTYQATQSGTSITQVALPITSCPLHNWDDTYRETTGTVANTDFYNIRGLWMQLATDGCFYKDPQNHLFVFVDNEFYEVIASPSYTAAWQATDCADLVYIHTDNTCTWIPTHTVSDNVTLLKGMDDRYWQYSSANGYWEEAPSFNVTFKNFNNKILEEATIYNNGTPVYTGYTPVKPTDDNGTYTFIGWSPEIGAVTEDKVYTALFSCAPHTASVTAYALTTYYTTLPDAFTAAKAKTNPTIKMLQDVSLGTSSVTYDGANTCTLDLNGHTISGTSNLLLIIDNASANFTITDNSESKLGKLSMNTSSTVGAAFCARLKKGKLYLEAGTIYLYTTSSSKNAVGARVDAGEFIMNGGTVHTVATQNNIVAHGVQPLNTANATINGGTVRAESANGVGSGIYVTGTITVNRGKFYVTGKTAYMVHEATTDPTKVKIQGGYYNINTNVANCATAPYYVRETTVEEKTEVGGDYNYRVVEKYTVTFKDGDNNTIQSGLVEKGQTPVYTGATPTKTATAQYTYTFNNTWSPAISAVTEAATYTAQFNNTVNSYEITWLNDDNSLIDKTTVEYGVVPTHADATKANTAEWTYTFTGWDNTPVAVTGNATYKATFSQTKNTYTVTWKDADGTTLETDENVAYGTTPTYNGATPTKAADEDYTYAFNGWTPAVGQIEGTTVYTATYTSTPNVASVTAGETTYYTTLLDAFTAAKAKTNPTIKLLQNVSMGATTLTYDGANICTLDLNGHEISGTARILLIIDNASTTFTITDNTESKLGKLSLTTAPTDKAAFCANLVNGTLKLEAGTIYLYSTSSNQNAVGARVDGGEFIMNGGTVHTVATQNNRVAHGVQPLNTANATINGGTVRAESANGVGSGIYVTGTITVNRGKFYVTGKTAYMVHEATTDPTKVKIQGGYYNINTNVANCATAPYYVRETTVEEKTEVGGDYNYRVVEKYTVTFKDGDNNTIQSGLVEKGQTPVYTGATPTKAAEEDRIYTFNDTWSPAISAVTAAATYTAQFNSILNNLTIGVSTIETVSTPRRTKQLIIESTGEQSGELLQAENLTVDDDAYFDLTIPGGVQPRDANGKATWYAIGVPWQVKALEGILLDGKPQTWKTCKILYYNSAERAANGPSDKCWTLLEDDGTAEKVLQPGRLYMIAFNRTGTTIRFVKKAGASITNTSVNVELYGNSNTNPTDANWNGIANPSTFKAYMNAESHINYDQYGDHYGQKYIPSSNTYEPFKMDANKLVVGQPIFVQATTNKPIVANATAYNSNIAARRNAPTENSNSEYELRITPESQNNCTDKIYLKVSDDKQDKYIIGQDLAKAGVSSKVAQMWVNRYDAKLCVNTMEPTNNTIIYPLGIYAPKAGDYCLSLAQSVQNGDAVYLTIDGTPIWNIGNSGYYLSLSAGTESRYGLLIVRRNTPATPTDLDTIGETENNSVQKIVLDGKVYILRNGEVFTITGQQIQ